MNLITTFQKFSTFLLLVLSGLCQLSCSHWKENRKPYLLSSDNWERIELAETLMITAITGNIDEHLVVTTGRSDASFTLDRGKTWKRISGTRSASMILGFYVSSDTIFALSCGFYRGTESRAGCPNAYFLKGKYEWHNYNYYPNPFTYYSIPGSFEKPYVTAQNGTVYYTTFSDNEQYLNKVVGNDTTTLGRFPAGTASIHSLHLDSRERLYVGFEAKPGLGNLYISKKSLP